MSSHKLHNGQPLSSHGYPRPYNDAFHGKPFFMHTPKRGLYSYKPGQVSSSLVRYTEELRNPNPKLKRTQRQNILQKRGLKRWESLESGEHEHLGMEEVLVLYAKCFNDLFFGGVLRGFCKIRFVDSTAMGSKCTGLCRSGRSFEHRFEIDIMISNRRQHSSFQAQDQPSKLRYYLSVLLHEMVHAVLDLYCCYTCRPCITRSKDEVGISGHSTSWQKLAVSIENVLNECLNSKGAKPFDLNRSYSFFLEFTGTEDYSCNRTLQKTLTKRKLLSLNLTPRTTRKISGKIQARDRERVAARRKAAEDLKKGLVVPKRGVQGGRVSKSDRSNSRH
jgi:hypothetical protein